jgi:hypothetical protein
MSEILLIEPYPFLSNEYRSNNKFAIYAEKSITYWSGDAPQTVAITYPDTIPGDLDIDDIKAKIHWTMPLWFRWMGQADRYEDFQHTCLLFVVCLAQKMRELEVKSVVFFTGVAHHIEYSLIEAACQIAGAQQIYLYPMPFCASPSRLLPVVQHVSIRDRSFLAVNVSDKQVGAEVIAYRDNHLAAKPPQLNEKIDRVATSYAYALARVAIFGAKAIAKAILRRNGGLVRHPIDERKDYDAFSILRIVRHQKRALEHYLSNMLGEVAVDHLVEVEEALPILYAHYQPEASTFPEGGDYPTHLDVVIAIRKQGYRGKILYKEHPGSWIYYSQIVGFSRVGLCRSIEYYRQLAALGCVFVPPTYKLTEARSRKLFPVTVTGSIGIERSMVGLATCCAGIPWFRGAPGIHDLAGTFGEEGVFYDQQRWQFEPMDGVAWFDRALSMKTINNYPGIGTGVSSGSATDKAEFLSEFGELMRQLDIHAAAQ